MLSLLATRDERVQSLAHGRKLADTRIDGIALTLGHPTRVFAMAVAPFQKCADFRKRKAKPLRSFDEPNVHHRIGCIATVTGHRPGRLLDQTAPLVIAHGLPIHTGRAGQLADGQR